MKTPAICTISLLLLVTTPADAGDWSTMHESEFPARVKSIRFSAGYVIDERRGVK